MKKAFCDITKDPNILEFVSIFAEQHDVMVSFTIRGYGLSGCDVHMSKNGLLESITLPRKELEIMDLDVIRSVLNHLLMRLESRPNILITGVKEEINNE